MPTLLGILALVFVALTGLRCITGPAPAPKVESSSRDLRSLRLPDGSTPTEAGELPPSKPSPLPTAEALAEPSSVKEAPPPTPAEAPPEVLETTADWLNVRKSPSNQAPVVAKFKKGTRVKALGVEQGFVKIAEDQYVAQKFLKSLAP